MWKGKERKRNEIWEFLEEERRTHLAEMGVCICSNRHLWEVGIWGMEFPIWESTWIRVFIEQNGRLKEGTFSVRLIKQWNGAIEWIWGIGWAEDLATMRRRGGGVPAGPCRKTTWKGEAHVSVSGKGKKERAVRFGLLTAFFHSPGFVEPTVGLPSASHSLIFLFLLPYMGRGDSSRLSIQCYAGWAELLLGLMYLSNICLWNFYILIIFTKISINVIFICIFIKLRIQCFNWYRHLKP